MSVDLSKFKTGELFDHYLKQHTDYEPAKNQSYTLYEDLKIIMALRETTQIQSKHFKELEEQQTIRRTYNSIKNRYVDYLCNLTEANLTDIATHLRQNGLVGYLQFSNNQPKQFLKVSLLDPKIMQSGIKKADDELEIPERKKEKQPHKKSNDPTFPKNDFDKFSVEDMDQVLQLLADIKKIPKAYLVERLHQLSGNLEDLETFFITNDETYCFVEEEDLLLKEEQDRNSPSLRLLIRKKGVQRVQRRLKYLGQDNIE